MTEWLPDDGGALVKRLTVLTIVACGMSISACRSVLSTVLDVPPAAEDSTARRPVGQPNVVVVPVVQVEDTIRPAIEALLDADSVRSLLPKDHAGNIDWMAALLTGVIDPRPSLDGNDIGDGGFRFAYDFFFPGPDTTLNAYFPHSSHTQWLDCKQCHARIFPYRNMEIGMADIFQGKYCGECHGKVAFPVVTACERCHVNLALPPDRAQPDLIGTISLHRVQRDTSQGPQDSVVTQNFLTASLPPAQFPHWVHRIRYRCKVCHMDIFEPRAGANLITMQDISQGKACGVCHDGSTAFAAGFGECQRCHVDPQTMAN